MTNPAITGLSSCVPKKEVPIAVVKQSMVPMKIKNKLWIVWLLNKIVFLLSTCEDNPMGLLRKASGVKSQFNQRSIVYSCRIGKCIYSFSATFW
ncbi:MAG TPA: hypothetical protein VK536_02680 [Candidatus Limnocylindrales bacterium]|nr:hypothetical protein [Candidatus Limnocylindrales bacterium]